MVLDKKTQSQSVSQCSQHFSNSFHPKGCVHLEVQVVREIRTVAELANGQKLKKKEEEKVKPAFESKVLPCLSSSCVFVIILICYTPIGSCSTYYMLDGWIKWQLSVE